MNQIGVVLFILNLIYSNDVSPAQHLRRPARECSKRTYCAIFNGFESDNIYPSCCQEAPYYRSCEKQYFYDGCICKGFDAH